MSENNKNESERPRVVIKRSEAESAEAIVSEQTALRSNRINLILNEIDQWPVLRDTFGFISAPYVLGFTSALSAWNILQHYRSKLRLLHYGLYITAIPILVGSGATASAIHTSVFQKFMNKHLSLTTDLESAFKITYPTLRKNYNRTNNTLTLSFLFFISIQMPLSIQERSCSICLELKAAAVQISAAVFYPAVTSFFASFWVATGYQTKRMPFFSVTFKDSVKCWREYSIPKSRLLLLAGVNAAVAMAFTVLQQEGIDRITMKKLIRSLDMDEGMQP